MTAEELKALDDFTKKFAQEAIAFEAQHGYLNGGFVTGVFRKLAAEYASQQREQGIRDGFEAARSIWGHQDQSIEHHVYPTVDDYLNRKSWNEVKTEIEKP